LPIRITFTNNRKIDIIYDATGKKWRKVVNDNGTETYRDYIGEAEYQNGQQDIIHFTEGYAQRDATTDGDANWKGWVYKYTLKDHLGNTRVTYSDKNNDGTAVGRFFVIDRFAEKCLNYSPYQYAGNNPIKNIDVNGQS
jgi:hypothetical protein